MNINENLDQPDKLYIGMIKGIVDNFQMKNSVNMLFFDKDPRFNPDAKLTRDPIKIGNTITVLGDEMVADKMSGGSPTLPSHMAVGTGTPSPNSSAATALGTELARVALDSTSQGTGADDNDVIWTATFPAGTGTGALTEAGVFNATPAGVMFCFTTFLVVNKAAADVIVFIWTMTCGDS
jgi:hypothetical protein